MSSLEKTKTVLELLRTKKTRATLFFGAGASRHAGVPLSREIPNVFASHLSDIREHRKIPIREQTPFYEMLRSDDSLFSTFCEWLGKQLRGRYSRPYTIFSLLWINRFVSSIVTTNWDTLFEHNILRIYDQFYEKEPFGKRTIRVNTSKTSPTNGDNKVRIDADDLFFAENLARNEFFWKPRFEILYDDEDLKLLSRQTLALYKIHGSPFFLYCQRCTGYKRWQPYTSKMVGKTCPEHSDTKLAVQITLLGEEFDRAHTRVWNRVTQILEESSLVLVVGYSGVDYYIRKAIQTMGRKVFVFAPSPGFWNIKLVNYIDLTAELLAEFVHGRIFVQENE